MNALLSDICIATSAAPTYLPTYYFETVDPEGNVREFNLTDGGVAANNPVYAFFKLHKTLMIIIYNKFPNFFLIYSYLKINKFNHLTVNLILLNWCNLRLYLPLVK